MSNLTDFIGGGGSSSYALIIDTSTTWTCPEDGIYTIALIGSGYGGGSAYNYQNCANGGASSGIKIINLNLSKNEQVVVTIGAGGAGATGGQRSNAPGGNTSFGSYISCASGENGNGSIPFGAWNTSVEFTVDNALLSNIVGFALPIKTKSGSGAGSGNGSNGSSGGSGGFGGNGGDAGNNGGQNGQGYGAGGGAGGSTVGTAYSGSNGGNGASGACIIVKIN